MRPDLTYLTQSKVKSVGFTTDEAHLILFRNNKNELIGYMKESENFIGVSENIPALVQLAETLHDMLESNPNSILFKQAEQVLNNLKK